ncbi:MAG TPA: hypothetical protein DCL54_07250 [Alphaproteobacteria bacterium]|nr:hypothetical protein [Alphaproteobacteria bacterium]HAJ46359.1 hypothetical protein [Alphaproteobacteria bacterium]
MPRLVMPFALLVLAVSVLSACGAEPMPEGWSQEPGGPRHLGTGLACPRDFMKDTMALASFGASKTEEAGKPYCTFQAGDAAVTLYVLERATHAEQNLNPLLSTRRAAEIKATGLQPWGEIALESGAAKTFWIGTAFDPSKGAAKEPKISTFSYAVINGWIVRLDLTYRMSLKTIDGAEQLTSPAIDIRNAVSDHLAGVLKGG